VRAVVKKITSFERQRKLDDPLLLSREREAKEQIDCVSLFFFGERLSSKKEKKNSKGFV
jgi:hypothetical protein